MNADVKLSISKVSDDDDDDDDINTKKGSIAKTWKQPKCPSADT